MERKKIILLLILIGVVFIILSPIMGIATALVILDSGQKELKDDSTVGITESYALEFTLGIDQTFHAEFSNYYQNVTVRLIIIAKPVYDELYARNGTPPNSGLTFRHYRQELPSSVNPLSPPSTTSDTYVRIDWEGTEDNFYVYIDFKGNNIASVPGDYVMLIHGTNEWAGNDEVLFDIKASIDGAGRILQPLLLIIGIVLLAGMGILLFRDFVKKEMMGGR